MMRMTITRPVRYPCVITLQRQASTMRFLLIAAAALAAAVAMPSEAAAAVRSEQTATHLRAAALGATAAESDVATELGTGT